MRYELGDVWKVQGPHGVLTTRTKREAKAWARSVTPEQKALYRYRHSAGSGYLVAQ